MLPTWENRNPEMKNRKNVNLYGMKRRYLKYVQIAVVIFFKPQRKGVHGVLDN